MCFASMTPKSYADNYGRLKLAAIGHSPNFRHSVCYSPTMAFQPMPLSRRPVPFDASLFADEGVGKNYFSANGIRSQHSAGIAVI